MPSSKAAWESRKQAAAGSETLSSTQGRGRLSFGCFIGCSVGGLPVSVRANRARDKARREEERQEPQAPAVEALQRGRRGLGGRVAADRAGVSLRRVHSGTFRRESGTRFRLRAKAFYQEGTQETIP